MTTATPGRLGVGVIGAGSVGPVLAQAFGGAGHTLTGINAVGDVARERVEAMLPGLPIRDIDEIVRDSELVLFAIPGAELAGLVRGLSEAKVWQPGQIVAHTAPEHGFSVFAPAMAHGVIPLAIHPAMVFTGTSVDLARLHESAIAVTAPTPVLPIAQALAVELGGEPIVVADGDRAAYADALDAARDLSRTVVEQATSKLKDLGLADPHRVVGSTVRAAVEEALLTSRGDIDVWQTPDEM